jgi:uncharacterized protein
MKLTGEATVRASAPEVYAALVDPAILVRTIPGCERLDLVGADTYRATVLAGVASIKGTFTGQVRLSDQDVPHSLTLHASGAGAPGTVSAVARLALAESDTGVTVCRYDADATIGGVIGGVGQRMIAGAARRMATDFFSAIERELAGVPAVVPVPPGIGREPVPAGVATELVLAGVATEPVSAGVGREPERVPAPAGVTSWTAPRPAVDLARQRVRDLMVGACGGAVIALLGVLVGAIVARW